MSDKKVLEKIRKLLALANEAGGGTEAERLLAAERAQDLMARHNLSELELEAESGSVASFTEETAFVSKMRDHWHGPLYNAIGKSVNVHVHYQGDGPAKRTFHFVGRPDSIQFVKDLAAYLIPALDIECEAKLAEAQKSGELFDKPRAFRTSFYHGAVNAIYRRLKERKKEQEANAGTTGMELMVNDEAALKRHLAQEYGRFRAARSKSQSSSTGRAYGQEAGRNADLSGGGKVTRGKGQLTAGSA